MTAQWKKDRCNRAAHEWAGRRADVSKTKRENIINSYQFIKIIFVHCFISRYEFKRTPHRLYETYRSLVAKQTAMNMGKTKTNSQKRRSSIGLLFSFRIFFVSLHFFVRFVHILCVIIIMLKLRWVDGRVRWGAVCRAESSVCVLLPLVGLHNSLWWHRHTECPTTMCEHRRCCVLYFRMIVLLFARYLFLFLRFTFSHKELFLLLIDILHRDRLLLFANDADALRSISYALQTSTENEENVCQWQNKGKRRKYLDKSDWMEWQ